MRVFIILIYIKEHSYQEGGLGSHSLVYPVTFVSQDLGFPRHMS